MFLPDIERHGASSAGVLPATNSLLYLLGESLRTKTSIQFVLVGASDRFSRVGCACRRAPPLFTFTAVVPSVRFAVTVYCLITLITVCLSDTTPRSRKSMPRTHPIPGYCTCPGCALSMLRGADIDTLKGQHSSAISGPDICTSRNQPTRYLHNLALQSRCLL